MATENGQAGKMTPRSKAPQSKERGDPNSRAGESLELIPLAGPGEL
jgi:hypothetical protein